MTPAPLATGARGMVCSPHHLATAAGLEVLRGGGNAVDAVIAVNAALQVVYPPMCHLGGDGFWMVWQAATRELVGLNGSGRAAAATSARRLRDAGYTVMPQRGPHTVTVPGCVDGWWELRARFGSRALAELLAPARRLAAEGFPISPKAALWLAGFPALHEADGAWLAQFWPGGAPPEAGSTFRQPMLAQTYDRIAEGGRVAFYEGDLARRVAAAVQAKGGWLTEDDLAAHRSDWVEPVRSTYRGTTIAEMPPNSQGTTVQLILNLLQLAGGLPTDPAARIDLMLRASALAYELRDAELTDPAHMDAAPDILARPETAARLAPRMSGGAATGPPAAGDTAYFCAADAEGNCCSAIQSLYYGFGSGIVVPDTGIVLQARGACFSLEPGHRNELRGGARTLHTLMPGMALRDGRPWLVFGTMGGNAQAQIHAQLVTAMVDDGDDPARAISRPRWLLGAVAEADAAGTVSLEPGLDATVAPLAGRGHAARILDYRDAFGHAHVIEVTPAGYRAAADPRADSLAAGL
ncbi:MAG TPA: gamma-glutamyltransferase family protein [Candidatus Dormibacteraeota bacterium]|jgi:gamma-glutamyltranspeptidase/glutathione hydrolase|nr:gamma-glutamyltransferase family protein [Candidatus Dormibacteraeota bacterium]